MEPELKIITYTTDPLEFYIDGVPVGHICVTREWLKHSYVRREYLNYRTPENVWSIVLGWTGNTNGVVYYRSDNPNLTFSLAH
jgi:hypothetical protein